MRKIIWIAITAIVLSACGGAKSESPKLSAPPTRTPAPSLPAEDTAADPQASLEVISLGEAINQFLARSAEITPLDQAITFMQTVGNSAPGCLNADQFELFTELAALHFPVMDLTAWQTSAQSFPAAALEQGIAAAAADVPDLLPADGSTLRVCLFPMPHIDMPVGELPAQGRRLLPHMAAMSDLNAIALDGSTLLVLCSAGEGCLDDLPLHMERAFGLAYQLRLSGASLPQLPLLSRLIFEGRADNFVVRRDPTATFAWDGALTPEGEESYWRLFRHLLQDDNEFYYDSMTNIVYGVYANNGQFPVWGGMYVGDQIVRAYLDKFPATSWPDLAALDPGVLLEESGYGPAAAQTRLVD